MGKTIFVGAIMCFEWADCSKGRLANYSGVFLPLVHGKASRLTSVRAGQNAMGERSHHPTPEHPEPPHRFQMTRNSWARLDPCPSSLRGPALCLVP